MKDKLLQAGMLFAVLLLVGQGCAAQQPADDSAEPAAGNDSNMEVMEKDGDAMEKKSGDAMMEVPSEGVTLHASALGENTVKFEWTVAEDLAERAEGYRFARGLEENPTYPSSWWWERGSAHRELVWEGLPVGEAHFRLCVVENGECSTYSNNVLVNVAGAEEDTAGPETAVEPEASSDDEAKKKSR